MKNFLRRIYPRLPIVRELNSLLGLLAEGQKQHRQILESAALIQTIELLKMGNERYRDPKRLIAHGAQYYSQNYEDGMIAEIFRRVGETSRTFLEIGVGDGTENNTSALLLRGWSGWWIEGDGSHCATVRAQMMRSPTLAQRLTLEQSLVDPSTVTELLARLKIPTEIDLFSLDIDLNTYHVWAALTSFRPRVVVVEYNAAFPPDYPWVHPFQQDAIWDSSQNFGASLKAYELLGAQLGYSLVGCDLLGTNAFFVRRDLVGDHFVGPYTAENHHEPARYPLLHRLSHPAKLFTGAE